MISRQVIEEILARTDIHQLIGKYVTLQRAGTRYKGLCPFHSEKTPSFTVFPDQNSFYCFGCGVGGDAISFVKSIENLEYPEAVTFLANQAGITITEDTDQTAYTPKVSRSRIYEANKEAARFFHKALFMDTPQARAAYSYLHDKRGLSDATIRHFGLGFAPSEYGVLSKHLRSLGFTPEELIYAGLCGKDPNKGYLYDFFYNRVMFPVIDPAGNVVAFGGRVMDNSTPKYRNTSETLVYNKRRILYGLNFAKDAGKEDLILCEGYMDVIAVQTAGFTNAVATCGTAITPEQARLMKRYAKRVLVSYDMDKAGRNATEKAIRLLEEVGIEVKILEFGKDGGKDPDEFIRQYGAEKFAQVLGVGKSKFQYNLERILSKYALDNPQDKIQAAKELSEMVAHFSSTAEREIYITQISALLQVTPDKLRSDVERIRNAQLSQLKKKGDQEARSISLGFGDKTNPDYVRVPAVARCEEAVLGLIMLYPEYLQQVKEHKVSLTEEDFVTELNLRIFRATILQEDTQDDLFADFTSDEAGRITKMKIDRLELSDNSQAVFEECINNLKNATCKARQNDGEVTLDSLEALLANKRKQ